MRPGLRSIAVMRVGALLWATASGAALAQDAADAGVSDVGANAGSSSDAGRVDAAGAGDASADGAAPPAPSSDAGVPQEASPDAGGQAPAAADAGASAAPGDAGPGGEEAPITVLPRLLQEVEAEYPPRARAEGVQAEVVLQIDIDSAGQVQAVEVLAPATPAGYGFDEAAVAAASRFVFSPAMAGDQPVPVRITYRYRFALAQEQQAQQEQTPGAIAPATPGQSPAPAPAAAAPAGIANLTGQLIVRGTRELLPGLVVTVFRGDPASPEQAFEATTDAEGRFAFYDLAPGTWHLLVEAEGYFPLRSTETVAPGERTTVRYYMERGAYNPFDVLVEADRPRREVSRTSLRIEQIERIPGTAGDALAVVQNLPGVARPPLLSGQILIRGAAPEDSRVTLEGVTIPIIYHFGALRSVIPTPMLSAIDFYPGNFGPEYGRAIGGVVDVRLKQLSPEHLGGIVDVSFLDANLYLEAPIGDDAAIAIAGRRSHVDFLIESAVGDDDEVNLVTAPRYYDAQLLARYRPARGHELRAFAMLSDDELKVLFENPGEGDVIFTSNEIRVGIDFQRAILDYAFTPSERFQNTLRLSVGNDETVGRFAQFGFNSEADSLQVRETARVSDGDDLALTLGIDYLFQNLNYGVYLPPPPREGVAEPPDLADAIASEGQDVPVHSFGAFLQTELTLWDRLSLFPGVRFDYFSRIDEYRLSPRATVRLTLAKPLVAKAGVGLFYQEPPLDETDAVFGNPDVGAEGAVHYSAGLEYRPLPHLLFDVTGFYKTLFDLVAPSDEVVVRDGERVEQRVDDTGEGRVYGAELMVRHDLSDNFTGFLAYTLMRSERRDHPGEPYRLFNRDQTHILTAIGSYRLPRNWEVSMRWRLVSGSPDTPVVGAVFNVDRDRYEPVFGPTYSKRIPPFHQLDLRIDKRFVWSQILFSVYLDIQNIYNRANPEGVAYSFDYSESRRAQGLPILPILGLRAEY